MARKYFKKTEESPANEAQAEATAEPVEAVAAEAEEAPAPKKSLIKRATYKTVYAVSFGAVFSSLLLRKLLIPKDSVVDSALHDGATAAIHTFEEKERRVEEIVEEVVRETEEILSVEELPTVTA
jgi:hypothetical protein